MTKPENKWMWVYEILSPSDINQLEEREARRIQGDTLSTFEIAIETMKRYLADSY